MSDTPRTDALRITCNRDCAYSLLELCRRMELEVRDRQALIDKSILMLHKALDRIAALEAELESWKSPPVP